MSLLVTIVAFLIAIGVLVTIHELGHYWAARWCDVKILRFSLGFGRPLILRRRGPDQTEWVLAALPLGGYVKMADERDESVAPEERARAFNNKTVWQRIFIVAAGPAANFLLAIAILTGFVAIYGQSVAPPVVQAVVEGSAAEKMGLKPGDRIQSIAGVSIDSFQDLAAEVSIHGGDTVPITYVRNGVSLSKDITVGIIEEKDRFGNRYKRGMLGLPFPPLEVREVSLFEAPFIAVRETANIVRLTVKTLGQIITGRRPISELGGPLKIAKVSGEQFVLGFAAFLWLTAMISINLGFINLLPIPMLDGGHLLLYGIEAVRRRPATPMVQEWAFRAGFAVLLGFMLMVTFNDLASFGLFGE